MNDRRTNDLSGPVPRLPEGLRVHDRAVDPHGRDADNPAQLPAKGWRDVAVRVMRQVKEDNIGLVGAGVAFYTLLALFPAMIALISLYGLVVKPSRIAAQIDSALTFIPQDARNVIAQQLNDLTKNGKGGLGVGLAVSIILALWSASGGMRALMTGLNIAYDETETRKFVRLRLVSLALTLGVLVFAIVALVAVVGVPARFDAHQPVGMALAWLRWPLLGVLLAAGLSAVYRYGPDRDEPKWSWASWGAGISTVLWLVMTVVFSFYVSSFAHFNKTYGTFAGVVVLMTWMSLSAYIALFGAEVNAELERQTTQDTTTGPDRPIGARDAYAADTVGATADELKGKPVKQK
jgi:membrane protein